MSLQLVQMRMVGIIWVLAGLLVAPFVPATYFAFMTEISPDPVVQPNLQLIFPFYAFTLAVTFLFGLPAYLLGRRLGVATWWSALISGSVVGALFSRSLSDLIILCPLGAVTAFLFWVFARRGSVT